MDVEPAVLVRLLELQAYDTALKRLQERRSSLPEAARLASVSSAREELEADVEIATKQHDEAAREQSRLEGEMEMLDGKIRREEQRLFSGGVSNPKELASLQAEVDMLKRKRADLEDGLLEVMVQKDQLLSTLDSLKSEHDAVSREWAELKEAVTRLTGEIDVELEANAAKRKQLAGTIPAPLLDLYERLRDAKGGVGAAAFQNSTCQGCHTRLPAKEAERIRNEGGLQRCDNCRRILVVT